MAASSVCASTPFKPLVLKSGTPFHVRKNGPRTFLTSSPSATTVPTFAPFAAALLNLASDHEDRYSDGFAGYRRVKESIFDRVPENRRVYGLSFADAPHRIIRRGKTLLDGAKTLISFSGNDAMGSAHNLENLAAALELTRLFLGRYPELPAALENFAPGAHRLRQVAEKCGRVFIDDSKATNPHAVFAALRAMTRPVVLLLGGLDKGMDFSPFAQMDTSQVRAVVLFGQCREKMRAALPAMIPAFDGGTDFGHSAAGSLSIVDDLCGFF